MGRDARVQRRSSGNMSNHTIDTATPTILQDKIKQAQLQQQQQHYNRTVGGKQSISSSTSSKKSSSSRKLSDSSASSSSSGYHVPSYETNYHHRYRSVSKSTRSSSSVNKSIPYTASRSYDEEDDDDKENLNREHKKYARNSNESSDEHDIITSTKESDEDNDGEDEEEDEDSSSGTAIKTKLYTDEKKSTNTRGDNKVTTIGLFGAYGPTGNHFLKLALDAGYNVQAMLLPSVIVPIRNKGRKMKKKTVTSSALQEEFMDYANISCSHTRLNTAAKNQEKTTNNRLEWIKSKRLDDVHNIKRTIQNVDYVVCMLSDTIHINDDGNNSSSRKSTNSKKKGGPLLNFIQILYPMMNHMKTIQVFLYQTTSLAMDVYGTTPILSKCMKVISNTTTNDKHSFYNLYDQDKSIEQISFYHYTQYSTDSNERNSATTENCRTLAKAKLGLDDADDNAMENHNYDDENKRSSILSTASRPPIVRTLSRVPHFSFIITRPTCYMKDGPSKHGLVSSKSQPGPYSITHIDLAEFSLNALLNKKLYNSCPYVVVANK